MTPFDQLKEKADKLLETTKAVREQFTAMASDCKDLKETFEAKAFQIPPGYFKRLVAEFKPVPGALSELHKQAATENEKLHKDMEQAILAFRQNPEETARNWTPDYGPINQVKEAMDQKNTKLVALRRALDMN